MARDAVDLPFPLIYLLSTRLSADEQHNLEGQIPTLTYDIREADIVLTDLSTPQRARFEMRRRGLATEISSNNDDMPGGEEGTSPRGRSWVANKDVKPSSGGARSDEQRAITAVRLEWFNQSMKEGEVLPLGGYVVYKGRVTASATADPQSLGPAIHSGNDIWARALADGASHSLRPGTSSDLPGPSRGGRSAERPTIVVHPPSMPHETTAEHDAYAGAGEIPAFMKTTYSCQRPAPRHPPNDAFVELLKKIRKVRTLLGDSVGVRAYSTAIATLAAYPSVIKSAAEIERLPGCSKKISGLFLEWTTTGTLSEVELLDSDSQLSVMALFYEIWGVGATTAREFYARGWRDLDDVIEHGWQSLSRVQQIGLKYYDEFLRLIPREEVEKIGHTILQHARELDPGFQLTIVGGYRRGKKGSGDVDVVVSHMDESATSGFVIGLVASLEKTGHITHTLTLSLHNTERGQEPVTWKGNVGTGTGFDTLDKALVVWQEPETRESQENDGRRADVHHDVVQQAGDKRPHRRVDIIISPWKTVGCAVLGWSGGTTFQRDLRRFCKNAKGLKFDSSGIRSRADGKWVDFEGGPRGPAPDMLTAEKRVFEGLGLEWRAPEERCTG